MTKQAKLVLSRCDFGKGDIRHLEKTLANHTAKQIIDLVWRRDPKGEHPSFEWFLPFFKNGYVPKIVGISAIFDDNFWKTYDMIDDFVEPYDNESLELISTMSMDTERVERAMSKSKPNIIYLFKVWEGLESISYSEPDIVEIKNYGVKTTELD